MGDKPQLPDGERFVLIEFCRGQRCENAVDRKYALMVLDKADIAKVETTGDISFAYLAYGLWHTGTIDLLSDEDAYLYDE